jgi:radical SAM superfamily enzyme YgiQ (UPF0313 family)
MMTLQNQTQFYDVVLIHPSEYEHNKFSSAEFSIPISLWYLGSYLTAEGYSVKVIDCVGNPNYMEAIRGAIKKTRLVGFTMMTAQIKHSVMLAKQVKELNPDLPIVVGGVHPTLYPREMVDSDFIDFSIYGEGELALIELLAALKTGIPDFSQIGGLSGKKDGKIYFNEKKEAVEHSKYPDLDYNVLRDILDNGCWDPKRIHLYNYPIITSRGCPYKCAFCASNAILERKKVRSWTMDKIIMEVKRALEFGFRDMFFWDDNLLLGKSKITAFLNEIKNLDTKFTWYGNVRADFFNERYLSKEFLLELRNNGLTRVSIGAESGSQIMLDYLEKGIKVEDYIRAAEYCKFAGIEPSFSFMVGLPHENLTDLFSTVECMKKIGEILPVPKIMGPAMYLPLPGNKMFNDCVNTGWNPPLSLDEWAGVNSGYGLDSFERPWIKNPQETKIIWFYSFLLALSTRKIIVVLRKYSRLVGYSKTKTLIVISAGIIGSLLGKTRMKFKFYSFPIELKLAKKFRELGAL